MSYNYVDPTNSNLVCCICRMPFVKPVTTRTCTHTFCSECIERALDHSSHCPVDRSSLTQDDLLPADPIVRSLVDELIIECANRSLGCTQTFQRQLLESHLKDDCQYTQITCGEPECEEVLLRKDVGKHAHNCVHRVVDCEGCQAEVKYIDMDNHLLECPVTTVSCPACSLDMPRSELKSHHAICPEVVVGCAHSSNGCPWNGPRHSVETHISSCPYEAIKGFFTVHNDRLTSLTVENATLRQKIDTLEGQLRGMKRDMLVVMTALGPWYRPDGVCPPISQQASVDLPTDVQPASASTSVSLNYDAGPSPPFSPTLMGGLSTIPAMTDPIAPFFPAQDREQFNHGSPPDFQVMNQYSNHHSMQRASSSFVELTRPAQMSVAPVNLSSTIEGAFESLRESIVTLAASVDSLARRNDIALTNETLRLNEEIMSLRANIHGLRMQVHTIMMDRNAQVTGRSNDVLSTGDGWQGGPSRIHFPPTLGHGSITKL